MADPGNLMAALLRGEIVRLTALLPSDMHVLAGWYGNPEFARLLDAEPAYPRTEPMLTAWLADQHRSHTAYVFGITLVETGRLVGYVHLSGILWSHRVTWLAIGIGEPADWGRGYGREALELTLRFTFQELNLHRVQLTVFSYNTRAIRLYERLGFVREGVYREFLERDGQRYDMLLYGLLRREWEP